MSEFKNLVEYFEQSKANAAPWREYPAAFEEYPHAYQYAEFYSVMVTEDHECVLMFGDSELLGQHCFYEEAVSYADSHAYRTFEYEAHMKYMCDMQQARCALREALEG